MNRTANDTDSTRTTASNAVVRRTIRWLVVVGVIAVVGLSVAWRNQSYLTGLASNEPNARSLAGASLGGAIAQRSRVHVTVAPAGSLPPPQMHYHFRGEIRARRESLLAFRRSGRLSNVLVDEGDHVKAGQLIAKLETSDLDAQILRADAEVLAASASLREAIAGPRKQTIEAAEARVRQLQANLRSLQQNLLRQEELARREAGTQLELDNARFDTDAAIASLAAATSELDELNAGTRSERLDASRAKLSVAKAARAQLDVDLADSQITAPYEGVIASRFLDEGTIVGPNQPVAKILESNPLEATFGVPAELSQTFAVGDWVELTVGESQAAFEHDGAEHDREFEQAVRLKGRIARLQPQVDRVTRMRGITVEFQPGEMNRRGVVLAGQTATLWLPRDWELPRGRASAQRGVEGQKFSASAADSFWLPSAALVRGTRGLWSVYVAELNNDSDVRVGDFSGGSESQRQFDALISRRDVRVVETSGQMVLVEGMLSLDDWLVVEGPQRVGPGVAVTAIVSPRLVAQ